MNQTVEVSRRGRGRPKIDVTKRIERALAETGVARTAFGERVGNVSEINARMRLYNAARRVGLRIRTHKVIRGGVFLMEGRVVEG